ncbi:MAG: DUF3598 family protein [Acidobacteriota bacterium]
MSDYPLFDRHVGVWEGTYTLVDRRTGKILDQHKSRLTCEIDGDLWHQTNLYTWDDGRVDEKSFDGKFVDGKLMFDTPRLKGEAVEADDKCIILRWVYCHAPQDDYAEIITLVDDQHRSRTWQHFEGGDFAKLTLIDERKVG